MGPLDDRAAVRLMTKFLAPEDAAGPVFRKPVQRLHDVHRDEMDRYVTNSGTSGMKRDFRFEGPFMSEERSINALRKAP